MSLLSVWKQGKADGSEKSAANVEFVLNKIDNESSNASITLADDAESSTLPATTSSTIKTLLQTIRNNLKWLFNNKVNKSGDTMTGTITGANKRGSWISAHTTNTAFYVPPNPDTGSTAQGVISWRTATGDGYCIANLNNTNVSRLRYATKANIDSGTNSSSDVMWFENGSMYVNTPTLP
jgi:hypothetical protein